MVDGLYSRTDRSRDDWCIAETLDGGDVLAGFVVELGEVFAELDRTVDPQWPDQE